MTQMVDSTETKTKLKKSVNYAFLPFSVPLLLLSSAAKVRWHYQWQPGSSFWEGEGSHTFLPFLLSRGTPLCSSKMPESTCINEVSGTDPEELQGRVKEEAPASFCISGPMQSEIPQGHALAPRKAHCLRSKGVSMGKRFLIPMDTHRNQSPVWQNRSKIIEQCGVFCPISTYRWTYYFLLVSQCKREAVVQ